MNVGLLSGATYAFYTRPELRRDVRIVWSAVAASLAILSGEAYIAKAHHRGSEEKGHTLRNERSILYPHVREVILRPGVLGGFLGLSMLQNFSETWSCDTHKQTLCSVNTGILGAVGYLTYVNCNQPRWDRRVLSAVAVGLLGLWTGEGYVSYQTLHKFCHR